MFSNKRAFQLLSAPVIAASLAADSSPVLAQDPDQAPKPSLTDILRSDQSGPLAASNELSVADEVLHGIEATALEHLADAVEDQMAARNIARLAAKHAAGAGNSSSDSADGLSAEGRATLAQLSQGVVPSSE